MQCTKCKTELPENATSCPDCGAPAHVGGQQQYGDQVGRDKITITDSTGVAIGGDVHIGDKVYTRSNLEELDDYLARAMASYEARMYQVLRRQPPPDQPYKFLALWDFAG